MTDTDPLWALTYVSRATRRLSKPELARILVDARNFNETHGITGFLAHKTDFTDRPGYFVQRIEGQRSTLIETLETRIETARAHSDLTIHWQGAIPRRSYPDWTMAFGRWWGEHPGPAADITRRLSHPVVSAPPFGYRRPSDALAASVNSGSDVENE